MTLTFCHFFVNKILDIKTFENINFFHLEKMFGNSESLSLVDNIFITVSNHI